MKKQRMTRAIYAIGLVLALLAMVWGMAACQAEEPEARSYNTLVYTEQGGAKLVIEDGGELEVQSGGTIDIQDGASVDMSGGIDLDGSDLTWDADGDTISASTSDDIVTHTIGAAGGYHVFAVGNLKVGDEVPTTSLGGEDAYIEGTFEVDGTVLFDSALDMSDNAISNVGAAGTDFSGTGGLTLADAFVVTAGGATITAGGLDMTADAIINIGNAGTDFHENGGLTVQDGITVTNGLTVTTGGLIVTLGGATITAGGLDMTDDAITNIGAGGTDFSASGGLTLADALVVTAGGATITAGGLDMTADAIINIGHAGTDFHESGGLTVQDGISVTNGLTVTTGGLIVTTGGATITAGGLDMTDDAITNIGASGTDFSGTGGLTLADAFVVTSGGATITAGGLDMTDDAITNIGASGTDFSATGGLTLADDLTITSALFMPGFADETITDGETLTPTLTVYALDSGGNVTMTLAAVGTEGQLLYLIGDDANDIIVADTNIRTTDGNLLTINQYDVVGFVYQDAEWILLFQSNNS